MIPRYPEIARHVGVKLCYHCRDVTGNKHLTGASTFRTVHFSPRTPTRAGIRKMLILSAEALDPAIKELTPWMRIWISNVRAAKSARLIGVSIPRSLSMHDRARVRFYLEELSDKDRDYFGGLYMQAHRWASRQ